MKKRWWYLPALTVLLVATTLIIRRNGEQNAYSTHTGSVFGTIYKITFQGNPALADSCLKVMDDVDRSLSMFNKESQLTALNNEGLIVMNGITRQVLTLALEVSGETDGAFDITVGPLVNAWGFGYKNGTLPDSMRIDSLMQHIGYERLLIDGDTARLTDNEATLDCSAIAKGFACDTVANYLLAHGARNVMVEIGGEVVTHGVNAKGKPWSVGISKPSEDLDDQGVMEIITLNNGAMATSGNYRNFRVEDGRKIAHTIDPHTGYPVQHSLLSATVFAPTCAMADAYATSFMVMGLEESKRILSLHPELSAYLIYDDGGKMNTVKIENKK
ncbi:MAG: FAD:protein FMN transferase [Bacteroidaceae bacterium]|nr:FAD:protein FMN transferase [Bacteroidaceae bacterium]